MSDDKPTHYYRGFMPCGHVSYLAVDMVKTDILSERKSLAKELGAFIIDGGHIDRVPMSENKDAAPSMGCPPDCQQRIKREKKSQGKLAP